MDAKPNRLDTSRIESSNYGPWGQHFGVSAWRALNHLSREPLGSAPLRWLDTDYAVFNSAIDVVTRAHTPTQLKPRLEARDDRALMENLEALHISLPLTEAERYWILAINHPTEGAECSPDSDKYLAEIIAEDENELISGGILRPIKGQAILHRWWRWRRQVGEFYGQRSVDEACLALHGIMETMTPRLKVPYWYGKSHGIYGDDVTEADIPSPLLPDEALYRRSERS